MKYAAMAAALGAGLFFGTAEAHADGLSTNAQRLSPNARVALQQEIAQFEASNPGVVQAVKNVQGVRYETYKKFRNPIPMAEKELRGLGDKALLPMLDALAFNAPNVSDLSPEEKVAYERGLIETVGMLRDDRAAPVLKAIFDQQVESTVIAKTVAEALGRMCGASELQTLINHTAADAPLRAAAIQGLGECQSVESVAHLAGMLDSAATTEEVTAIASALTSAAASYAWKAKGDELASDQARSIAAKALMAQYVSRADADKALRMAIVATEHGSIPSLVSKARVGASTDLNAKLDRLATILDRAMARKAM